MCQKLFNAFNVFRCGRMILERLDVSYERACMATPKEEYFGDILDHLIKHNRRHSTPMSNEKLREAVIRVMEYEEKDPERNVNNVTTDNLFWSPATVNAQNKDVNVTYEIRISSGIFAEKIK